MTIDLIPIYLGVCAVYGMCAALVIQGFRQRDISCILLAILVFLVMTFFVWIEVLPT